MMSALHLRSIVRSLPLSLASQALEHRY